MEDPIEEWLSGHESIAILRQFPSGTQIGDWVITAFLARGGAGEVYRAENMKTGVPAAIKVLHKTDESAEWRFSKEADFLSRIDHPSFPRLYARGVYDGHPYFVMEILEPFELPGEDADVASFLLSLCVGVAYLHSRGYVHRDIKPANIMARKGYPVLIDLGLLKNTERTFAMTEDLVSVVDGHAVGVGTPGYAAPEQLAGELVSPSADLHALGVLANTCFRGTPPPSWREIIRRSTSTLPSQRYGSVPEFARAIRFRHCARDAVLVSGVLIMVAFFLVSHFAARHGQNEERNRQMRVAAAGGGTGVSSQAHAVAGSRRLPAFPDDPGFSRMAGLALGATQFVWRTSSDYPWLIETNVCFNGSPSMKNTGNGGGEAVSLLVTEMTGPLRLRFRYRKNFYGSRFQVVSDGVTLFVDAEASHGDHTWYDRTIQIPSGTHKVYFVYHHAGIGWANEFNGIYLSRLTVERIAAAADPLDDVHRGEHYYLVPNVNFSKSATSTPANAISAE